MKPVEDGRYITHPTVWIGVVPDRLDAELAHEAAHEILEVLKRHNVSDVDVAFRESVAMLSRGPALFGPHQGYERDALKDLIDHVSTPLSLPIAGIKTKMQGTLGFYFRVQNDLYAVTARHVLLNDNEGNSKYKYCRGGPKEVIVMGPPAFDKYVTSIQAKIFGLNHVATYLQTCAVTYKRKRAKAEEDSPDAQKWEQNLKLNEAQLTVTRAHIEELKDFFGEIKKNWGNPKDRVIGYVDWAPPIVAVPPHRYTMDLCVIKLDKKKFKKFLGNVLSLGPEISIEKFVTLIYDRIDVPSEFMYPEEALLPLRGMLTAADLNNPNSKNLEGERIRRVIRGGLTTLTTVGTLSRFMSYVRKYTVMGAMDSIEVAILPYDNGSGPFSRGGDSASLVVDALRRFAALLTGGSGETEPSDITYATLMEWVWVLIKDEYKGANLYFEDLEAFLADVVAV